MVCDIRVIVFKSGSVTRDKILQTHAHIFGPVTKSCQEDPSSITGTKEEEGGQEQKTMMKPQTTTTLYVGYSHITPDMQEYQCTMTTKLSTTVDTCTKFASTVVQNTLPWNGQYPGNITNVVKKVQCNCHQSQHVI